MWSTDLSQALGKLAAQLVDVIQPCAILSALKPEPGIIPGISLSYTHLDSAGLRGDGSVGNWSHIAALISQHDISQMCSFISIKL